ncbi:unnamed protein product [Ambrosiozyma monospora]|uniref:Unnamed protein product n=1 Tax=Ambrosiozyma monospora TaxID=43982 RepID=A0ACB5T012_AMBMO|nr:unnamed protein product [Ambrosiozyma monospora]
MTMSDSPLPPVSSNQSKSNKYKKLPKIPPNANASSYSIGMGRTNSALSMNSMSLHSRTSSIHLGVDDTTTQLMLGQPSTIIRIIKILRNFVKYIGPGLMVSVAYMDPGNFSSSIASAQFQYKLLFSLMVSNIMAGFLQVLASKLGICTGQDLASNCRAHLSPWLNYIIYVFGEIAVIATDVAEIIGTAIAFNIIFDIPLFWGVILTIIDVLFVIMAYRPNGPMVFLRLFEGFVSVLVMGTVICFAIELANVSGQTNWGDVFMGFLPNSEVFKDINGLYLSAALLGSNLMPHSLYLGSGVVQARLKAYDIKSGHYTPPPAKPKSGSIFCGAGADLDDDEVEAELHRYKPSLSAINATMSYTIAELIVSLFTVALFVNSAILIVAGTALSKPMDDDADGDLEDPDLFTLHYLLTKHLSTAAGTVFAFALLCSGLCGGTVVTVASQQIMEGHAHVSMPPGLRRIITRVFALAPCIYVVLTNGREGLSSVLNGSQVVLSLLLPFISAPLIYFTCSKHIMKVKLNDSEVSSDSITSDIETFEVSDDDDVDGVPLARTTSSSRIAGRSGNRETEDGIQMDFLNESGVNLLSDNENSVVEGNSDIELENGHHHHHHPVMYKDMSNSRTTAICAVLVWVIITVLNFWLLASMALGIDVPV